MSGNRSIGTPRTARFVVGAIMVALPTFAVAAAEEPAWLQQARAREAKLVDAQPFASTDGVVTGRARAKLVNKVEPDEGTYYLEFDIGTDAPVSCEVLIDGFDVAQLLRNTAELSFESLAAANGKIDTRHVERIDAGVIGANPYIAADWLYRAQTDKGPMLGGFKHIALDMHSYGVYCAHVDLGFSETFRTVVRGFVESLQIKGAAPPVPRYVEIQTMKLGDQPVGVARLTVTADDEGDLKSLLTTSLLAPAGQGVVLAQDSTHLQWTTAEGELLNAAHVTVSNGELDLEVRLERGEDEQAHWHAVGTFKGKAVENDLGPDAPATILTQVRERRTLLGSAEPAGKETKDQMWVAIDPTRLIPTTFRIGAKDASGRYTAIETSGPLEMESVMDAATGTATTSKVSMGPRTLLLERAYLQGSL
ncbi:MAG TPA: hypothetical protein VNS57_02725 [Steroidobacteraceae bacterium]|nr:hypothetical protein [Steroidobacteraceae bacterium]